MRVIKDSELTFSTTSNVYTAIVAGPSGAKVAKSYQAGIRLPTNREGAYALFVVDRNMASHTVTLSGDALNAQPQSEEDTEQGLVTMTYQVVTEL